jgi:hypothetical protein
MLTYLHVLVAFLVSFKCRTRATCGRAIFLAPINRLFLGLECSEHVIRMILHNKLSDRRPFW